MGVPCYGQSFVLSSAQNHGLNAPSYGPGEAGKYTRYEINSRQLLIDARKRLICTKSTSIV